MKNIIIYSIFILAAAVFFPACTKTVTPEPGLSLSSSSTGVTISPDGTSAEIMLPASGASAELTVASNWNWEISEVSGNWCAAEITASGIVFSASGNGTGGTRNAVFTIVSSNDAGEASVTVAVEQPAEDGMAALAPEVVLQGDDSEIVIPEEGGSYRVDVNCEDGWMVYTPDSWITVSKDETGFVVSAETNTTYSALSGTVVITSGKSTEGETVTVPVHQFSSVKAMVIEMTVGEASDYTVVLPFDNNMGVVNCLIDWGDGKLERVVQPYPTHRYGQEGVYDVKITGKVSSFRANQQPECEPVRLDCITAIKAWGNIGLESLKNAFYICEKLKSVAAPDEGSFDLLTTVYQCFYSNTSLETLPERLFADLPQLESAYATFSGCSSLKAVPDGLFAGCSGVTTFFRLFWRCRSITEIGEGIFDGCVAAENFGQTFYQDSSLTALPENLFASCTAADGFSNTFNGCVVLKDIPGNIFPENETEASMMSVFANCVALESVPEGLFAPLAGATNFNSAFLNCTALKSVPVSLFDNNKAVTNFGKTFSGCSALTGESPYTVIDGVDCHLYERGGYSDFATVKTTAGCFLGCTGLDDYATIETQYPDWL